MDKDYSEQLTEAAESLMERVNEKSTMFNSTLDGVLFSVLSDVQEEIRLGHIATPIHQLNVVKKMLLDRYDRKQVEDMAIVVGGTR